MIDQKVRVARIMVRSEVSARISNPVARRSNRTRLGSINRATVPSQNRRTFAQGRYPARLYLSYVDWNLMPPAFHFDTSARSLPMCRELPDPHPLGHREGQLASFPTSAGTTMYPFRNELHSLRVRVEGRKLPAQRSLVRGSGMAVKRAVGAAKFRPLARTL